MVLYLLLTLLNALGVLGSSDVAYGCVGGEERVFGVGVWGGEERVCVCKVVKNRCSVLVFRVMKNGYRRIRW